MNIVPVSIGRVFPFPLTTIGWFCGGQVVEMSGFSSETSQTFFRPATLLVLICFRVEYAVPARSPWVVGQSFPAGWTPPGSHVRPSGDAADFLWLDAVAS